MGLLKRLLGQDDTDDRPPFPKAPPREGTGISLGPGNRENPTRCPTCEGNTFVLVDTAHGPIARCSECNLGRWGDLAAGVGDDLPTYGLLNSTTRTTSDSHVCESEVVDQTGRFAEGQCYCPDSGTLLFHIYTHGKRDAQAIECASRTCEYRAPESANWDTDGERKDE